jgi:hypothetical protein
VREREIFGKLVPWGEVWRTGAGHCTRFSQPVRVGGQSVPAGSYALLTIPQPLRWRVILNADTTLYGAYDYDPEQNVAHFIVPVRRGERFYEALTIDLDLIPNDARLYLSWAHTQISFLIETGTDEDMRQYIQTDLLEKAKAGSDAYAEAAHYLLSQRQDYRLALRLTGQALAADSTSEFAYRVRMETYEALGHRALALVQGKTFASEADRAGTLAIWEEEVARFSEP